MPVSRRYALLAGVGLVLTGCGSSSQSRSFSPRSRPSVRWPEASAPAANRGRVVNRPRYQAPDPTSPTAPSHRAGVEAISRASWSKGNPVPSRLNTMGRVSYLTVHHEGWTAVNFTDHRTTAARIEQIRSNHVDSRGWGDIGYHFIVDRGGNVWEGRPLTYQGAHVHDHNPHNIGVLTLGNFEKQHPSQPQLDRLVRTLQQLMSQYRVSRSNVYTHRELTATACPGRYLQQNMVNIRRGRTLT